MDTTGDVVYDSDGDNDVLCDVGTSGIRERRRRLHTEAEQRRRDAIKKGFESLFELVHPVKSDTNSPITRMSKSTILHKAISMIHKLGQQTQQKRREMEDLQKEVQALRIMNAKYERIAQADTNRQIEAVSTITEDTRLQLFQTFADLLFETFDEAIVHSSFADLTDSTIIWVEQSCKPERLSSLVASVLARQPFYELTQENPTVNPHAPHSASDCQRGCRFFLLDQQSPVQQRVSRDVQLSIENTTPGVMDPLEPLLGSPSYYPNTMYQLPAESAVFYPDQTEFVSNSSHTLNTNVVNGRLMSTTSEMCIHGVSPTMNLSTIPKDDLFTG